MVFEEDPKTPFVPKKFCLQLWKPMVQSCFSCVALSSASMSLLNSRYHSKHVSQRNSVLPGWLVLVLNTKCEPHIR